MKNYMLLMAVVFGCLLDVQAQDLPRKPWLGAQLADADSLGIKGTKLLGIVGGTSKAVGLQPNDVVVLIDKNKTETYAQCVTIFKQKKANDSISFTIYRNQQRMVLRGKTVGRAEETDDNATVLYDYAPYKGGKLRVIINKPFKEAKMPAMLFVPGYTCSSIDNMPSNHPYKRIIDAYVDAGYVTLRIEKSGLGDSENTPACESCDLLDEVENFEVGLKKLKSLPYVDTNQVIVVGHSMGGVIAPALSAKHKVAGVVVYGTTAKSWFEYQLELLRVQNALAGMNPLEVEESVREQYAINYRYFILKEELEDIAKDPKLDTLLRTSWEFHHDGRIYGRNAQYWRQIQDFPSLENWKKTTAKVLVQFGESDFQAFSKADHEQIVNTVNFFHPGNATLKTYPLTDHYFAKSGMMQAAFDKFSKGEYQTLFDEYNPAVGNSAVEWSNAVLGRSVSAKPTATGWQKLNTEKYPGKQDDITFINEREGWYVNGYGAIFHTRDGGTTWEKQLEKKGTFFRCIAFMDSLRGFAGTVGTDYFPNVTDTIPLYGTADGGKTWKPVAYEGKYVKGLCAIDIVPEQYINRGNIAYKYHIYAVGRVGGPANMLVSHDGGTTWKSMPVQGGEMLFDIKMFDTQHGIACSATSSEIANSHALILKTDDAGNTWKAVYQSNRPFETTWKVSFPTREIGYATIQSYNPDTEVKQQRIAKTIDGGNTWQEIDLVADAAAREFGIGFIDENHGFVGTMTSGYETLDGGKTWQPVTLGRACNKIRIYKNKYGKPYGFAIGVDVMKASW